MVVLRAKALKYLFGCYVLFGVVLSQIPFVLLAYNLSITILGMLNIHRFLKNYFLIKRMEEYVFIQVTL